MDLPVPVQCLYVVLKQVSRATAVLRRACRDLLQLHTTSLRFCMDFLPFFWHFVETLLGMVWWQGRRVSNGRSPELPTFISVCVFFFIKRLVLLTV